MNHSNRFNSSVQKNNAGKCAHRVAKLWRLNGATEDEIPITNPKVKRLP